MLLATRLVQPIKAAPPHIAVDMLEFKWIVILLQGEGDCVPCLHEGYERHRDSLSDCLQPVPLLVAFAVLEKLLHGANATVCPSQ